MKINNHDAYCIEWYRSLIPDGLAEDGQRIAVEMHDQLRELELQIERDNPEPCPYCADGVYYDVLGSPCKYEFCPMCGRRLSE